MSKILYVYVERKPDDLPPFSSAYVWKAVSMNGDSFMKYAEGLSPLHAINILASSLNTYRSVVDIDVYWTQHRIVNFEEILKEEREYIIDSSYATAKRMVLKMEEQNDKRIST